MADLPIIFSGPMVRALLDGHKTMTRRLAWSERRALASPWARVKPGDRLYVRENFQIIDPEPGVFICAYAASCPNDAFDYTGRDGFQRIHVEKWRPSIHLLRSHSRITLLVEAVKVERLQDISEEDAIREGVYSGEDGDLGPLDISARALFADLWKSLHGPESAAANPEVVAISFKVVRENIDKVKEAA